MGDGYWIGAHTKHRLKTHIVWIPKFRKRVLKGKIAKRVMGLLYQACEVNNWWIHELAIQSDHVHILVQLPPKVSISYAVQIFKGGSSRKIREEFPELEEFLWGESFWADGYFAESVGRLEEDVIKTYIRDQRSMPQSQV
ncbi:MAG: IS200/IS605 family transposase [bacterium]